MPGREARLETGHGKMLTLVQAGGHGPASGSGSGVLRQIHWSKHRIDGTENELLEEKGDGKESIQTLP